MDIVKRRGTTRRRGARSVGAGSRHHGALDLPLSLALLRVVLVEVSDELFAIPTAAIRRIFRFAPRTPRHEAGTAVEVGDDGTPLIALSALLQIAPAAIAESHQSVVIVEAGDGRFGLIVDAVQEEQELVFKELRGPLRSQLTFAGAALLGNGDIVPILDIQALFELAAQSPAGPAVVAAIEPRAAAVRRAKCSLSKTRWWPASFRKAFCSRAGYEADLAHDGAEALEMLQRRSGTW